MQDYQKKIGTLCGEILYQKYQQELASSKENGYCSRAHYRKMSVILDDRVRRPITPTEKVLIALLAAVLLLLSGCAISRYGDPFGEYFMHAEQGGFAFFPQTSQEEKECLDAVYLPGYLPEGYTLADEDVFVFETVAFRTYRNETGETIYLSQKISNASKHHDEKTVFKYITIGEYSVLQCKSGKSPYVIYHWSNEYYFTLFLHESISDEEAIQIIESMSTDGNSIEENTKK